MTRIDSFQFSSASTEVTRSVGRVIARHLTTPMLIALDGTLGAGKTSLVQGIAEGLGIDRRAVVSPTFSLIQTYAGRLPLVHIDAYRIADRDEYQELGIDEYLEEDAVVVIEWARRISDCLPDERLSIEITVTSETHRSFEFAWAAESPVYSHVCLAIRDELDPGQGRRATGV